MLLKQKGYEPMVLIEEKRLNLVEGLEKMAGLHFC
jgi:hypothetical protein